MEPQVHTSPAEHAAAVAAQASRGNWTSLDWKPGINPAPLSHWDPANKLAREPLALLQAAAKFARGSYRSAIERMRMGARSTRLPDSARFEPGYPSLVNGVMPSGQAFWSDAQIAAGYRKRLIETTRELRRRGHA